LSQFTRREVRELYRLESLKWNCRYSEEDIGQEFRVHKQLA
jgi:hypothetical protein